MRKLEDLKLAQAPMWTLHGGDYLTVPDRDGKLHVFMDVNDLLRWTTDAGRAIIRDDLNTIARDHAFPEPEES